jgi:serine/threonine protein phosphatase PrpC
MRIRPGIELGNLTDVGCERDDNQDYYCYAEPEPDSEFERKGRLAVIADGMGGYEGGAIASGIAVDVLRARYLHSECEETEQALVEAITAAHEAVRDFAREHPEVADMGTTCTAAVLRDGHLSYVHVGDSRLYLFRNSEINQLTRDHTVTERLIEEGRLRPEDAPQHRDYHVLTAALGVGRTLHAQCPETAFRLRANDVLLLCTDGLHDVVTDEEMRDAALAYPAGTACQKLIDQAKSRGGPDNITLQIIKVQGAELGAEMAGH